MKTSEIVKTFIFSGVLITLFKYIFSKFDQQIAAVWVSIPLSFLAVMLFSKEKNKSIKTYTIQSSFTYLVILLTFLISMKHNLNTTIVGCILAFWIFLSFCHTIYILKNKKNKLN